MPLRNRARNLREYSDERADQVREKAARVSRVGARAGDPGRSASQIGRIIGKATVKMADDAKALGRGMERVFGEDMTRPGDGFNRMKAGRRAEDVVRNSGRRSFSQFDLDRGEPGDQRAQEEGRNFFGNEGYKNDPSNDENFWNSRDRGGDFY